MLSDFDAKTSTIQGNVPVALPTLARTHLCTLKCSNSCVSACLLQRGRYHGKGAPRTQELNVKMWSSLLCSAAFSNVAPSQSHSLFIRPHKQGKMSLEEI